MTLGLAETRARRRRSHVFWGDLFRWIVILGIVAGAGFYAYDVGSGLARADLDELQSKVDRLSQDNDLLRKANAELQGAVRNANRTIAEWQSRYEAEVPDAAMARMLALVQARLDAGVEPDRVAFLIESATNERDCGEAPITKRFIVRTPIYTGASDSVSFAENAVTVTATGESARNAAGQPEAWFDPDQPVTVTFAALGGETTRASGVLPVHLSVVAGGQEYRFSLTKGESRAFVNVTGERCAYP